MSLAWKLNRCLNLTSRSPSTTFSTLRLQFLISSTNKPSTWPFKTCLITIQKPMDFGLIDTSMTLISTGLRCLRSQLCGLPPWFWLLEVLGNPYITSPKQETLLIMRRFKCNSKPFGTESLTALPGHWLLFSLFFHCHSMLPCGPSMLPGGCSDCSSGNPSTFLSSSCGMQTLLTRCQSDWFWSMIRPVHSSTTDLVITFMFSSSVHST